MANQAEVKEAIITLYGARLRNAPSRDEITSVIAIWSKVFRDTPAKTMEIAADDYIIRGQFWPTIAEFRGMVSRVNYNHGQSVDTDPSRERVGKIMYIFDPETGEAEEVEVIDRAANDTGVYRVCVDGWQIVEGLK